MQSKKKLNREYNRWGFSRVLKSVGGLLKKVNYVEVGKLWLWGPARLGALLGIGVGEYPMKGSKRGTQKGRDVGRDVGRNVGRDVGRDVGGDVGRDVGGDGGRGGGDT